MNKEIPPMQLSLVITAVLIVAIGVTYLFTSAPSPSYRSFPVTASRASLIRQLHVGAMGNRPFQPLGKRTLQAQ